MNDLAETAELLVSELITNAVKASRAMDQRPPVWLRLSASHDHILIEVWDGNPEPPVLCELEDGIPGLGNESGRGLFLVASLSERWNWYPTYDVMGKVVWCLLATEQLGQFDQREAAVLPLPRRIRRDVQARPARVMDDPNVLLRLRDGLLDLDSSSEVGS